MSSQADLRTMIDAGHTALGIEFGSTRIKAVLTGEDHRPIAVGVHEWENQYDEGVWTYPLQSVWAGVQQAFASLAADVRARCGTELRTTGALGVSAMMHGYLAFDAAGELLVPFRTWRNTTTQQASDELSEAFDHNIPLRWSVAHVYQAVLGGEEHVGRLDHLTTLAGYVHWRLSGERVLGVGDASGMFPIDVRRGTYDASLLRRFDELAARRGVSWQLESLLPRVLTAGDSAGSLSAEGAALLDPTGTLAPGVLMCPPEGDAGTGMVATNSVRPRTGNVSAGTSIFAMVVLEHPLASRHHELDLVTTPAGDLVAMVHCNNGASELNAWASVFADFATRIGASVDAGRVFEALFGASLEGETDGGGLLAYNYLSGEPVTGLPEGRPLFSRTPGSRLTLPNFMRTQLYAAFATLRIGMDVLAGEGVGLDAMFAHGGLFKTPGVAQRYLAAALGTPVAVGDIAGEGGAWGMAVLAAFARDRAAGSDSATLDEYLQQRVFGGVRLVTLAPDAADVAGFDAYVERYRSGLAVERAAVEHT